MKKPNILMIVADQYRGDCFSFKGHPDVQTPNLDSLAAEGVNFDRAYSAVPSCIPARAIMATGKLQKKTKLVGYQDGVSWNYSHFLPDLLRAQGYQTQCVGKMHVHPPRKNCGFENVRLHDGYLSYYRDNTIPYCEHQTVTDDYLHDLKAAQGVDADITATGIDPNSRISYPWPFDEQLHPSNWVSRNCEHFLRSRDRERPFFLMASYVRPHQPFDAPAFFQNLYRDKVLHKPYVGDWENEEQSRLHSDLKDSIFGTCQALSKQRAMEGYYANITHLDSQIGRLIMALQEDGSFEDSIILFVSDHGEQLFDHHTYRKAFPYQGSIQVPMIFRVGKQIADTGRRESAALIGLQDILPTLVDFAGGQIPEDVDGLSFKQEILGRGRVTHDYIHGEHAFKEQCSSQFIVTEKDKYVWFSERGEEQYFDLLKDPHELKNRIDDRQYQARIEQLKQQLIKELAGRQEGFVVQGKLQAVTHVVNVLD